MAFNYFCSQHESLENSSLRNLSILNAALEEVELYGKSVVLSWNVVVDDDADAEADADADAEADADADADAEADENYRY